jgi:integrase
MRAGEISKLQWRDVDLENGIITVRGEICKTGVSRQIPIMTNRLKEELSKLESNAPNTPLDFVFGKHSVRKSFYNACIEARINNFRIHDCRHTAITRWIAKAMKYSGHTVMSTFMRYLNLKSEEMQRDAEVFKIYDEQMSSFSEHQVEIIEATSFVN